MPTILAPDYLLTGPDPDLLLPDYAVLVRDERIAAIGPMADLLAEAADARVERLADCVLMAGLVNAHQHGRSLTAIQLGFADEVLELWIAGRRRRGVLDPGPLAQLAALDMLQNGVTCAVHANTALGSGDYEAEIRAALAGYDAAGLRVVMCVGAQDRGFLVYPDHAQTAFLAGLSPGLQEVLARPRPHPYAGDLAATTALMDRLLADFAGHPRISFCYGPAGPQWVSDELMAGLARDAEKKGIGLHMHALESLAQSAVCKQLYPDGTFAHLDRLGALSERTVIAHGVYMSPADIEIAARRGVTVVRNPGSNLRLRNGTAPLGDFLRYGLRVAIGTDNSALHNDEDLLAELRLAAGLARTPDWHIDDRPDVTDQLSMLTVNGARAAQLDGTIGRISVGMRADLAAISLARATAPYLDPDCSPLDLMLARAGGSDIRLAMVDGRILYRDGRLAETDRSAVEERVRTMAEAAAAPTDAEAAELLPELKTGLIQHYQRLTRMG